MLKVPTIFEFKYFLGFSKLYLTPACAAKWIIIEGLNLKPNSGLIIRTAGGNRTKTEIRRDYDFLLKGWESIKEQTLSSIAPTLIHAEGNLI